MHTSRFIHSLCVTSILALLAAGCSNLPGTSKQQGAVIGGAGGAVAGAAIGGEKHRAAGALLGGILGAGGGYVIGAHTDKTSTDTERARQADQTAQTQPATPEQARASTTADLNHDGFVTLDEVVAMRKAGLSDQEMINRLRATGQVFDLTPEQQRFLLDQGVSQSVVSQMQNLNRAGTLSPTGSGVISQPPRSY